MRTVSGERTSFRYATEKTREIPGNVPFGILGTTQMPFAARLIGRLDQGHGLLDRFLFCIPSCLRPCPEETSAARQEIGDMNVASFKDVFWAMREEHLSKRVYSFTESASKMLMALEGEFIESLNTAMEWLDRNVWSGWTEIKKSRLVDGVAGPKKTGWTEIKKSRLVAKTGCKPACV